MISPATTVDHSSQVLLDTAIQPKANSQGSCSMQKLDNIERHEGRYVEAQLYVGHCYAEHLGIALQRKPLNKIKDELQSFVLTAAEERKRENEAVCPGYDLERYDETLSLLQKIQVLDHQAEPANIKAIANGLDEIAKSEDVEALLERLGGKADPNWTPHVNLQLYPEPSYTTFSLKDGMP